MKQTKSRWGEKKFYSLDYYLKESFGQKLYKLSLNGGMTCPNRDGSLGTRGCIFCSRGGSGDFAASPSSDITSQIEEAKSFIKNKYTGNQYIAYFQAYTNTYAPVEYLKNLFTSVIRHPDIAILSIATRPDCLSDEVIDLLEQLNQIKPVWIELGLQTIHEHTASFIRRGYQTPVFRLAVERLRAAGINVIVHTILALPGETMDDMLATIHYLNDLDIQGIKLQLLHVLKDTDLADYYKEHPFFIPTVDEYCEMLGKCICHLRPDIVIHRLTGDGPKSLLIAPEWTGNKRNVLNKINSYLKEKNLWQGKEYKYGCCK